MQGQADIFMHYVQPHWNGLHFAARQYARSKEDASDLVQETLLRAWKNFSPVGEKEYRRAWLFTIMRNVVVDWQRTNKRRIRLHLLPHSELTEIAPLSLADPFCPMPAMDEERFLQFLDDSIVAALDCLDPPFREVIILSVVGELNYREIAEVLDCPVGTVMSRMARARRMLRERLADLIGRPKNKARKPDEVEQ